jgi:glycosyltransferase involved in cell wall biosynthesis
MSDVPRLCMVVHGDFPLDPRVAREARAARAAGWRVDVVAMRRAGERRREIVEGSDVLRLPFSHRRGVGPALLLFEYVGFAVAATLVLAVRSITRRYTVVQIHNPPDFLLIAAFVPRLMGARVVFDVHDLSPDMFDMRFHDRLGARAAGAALRLVERWAAGSADQVVTVHEPYRRELAARGISSERIAVVMNTADEAVLPELGDPRGDGFRIVYHGTVTPHYGVDLLVEAIAELSAELPEANVEIYGEGDLVPRLLARAAELGITERVVVSGRMLQQRDVLARVAGASVGVIPNRPTQLNRFALSSKLFEYVALGIPVLSADLPTIRAHFGDQEIRYFRAGDATALADGLRNIANHPEAAAARAVAARRRYDEHYSWAVNAERYVAILQRLRARATR